ncbi:hypothetical protein [Pseudomonas syringae]|uniref:hypothetical protein n=1 Tax=Pseudomonas syringae TaxID=317 RepID=UPI00138A101D|nr:hypothetical protein [Pseudomonas syringae]MDF5892676.1 hypothetical protein [Pseudomonas syringae pv. syringae]
MALGNFRCRLRDSVEILATHKSDVKTRLYLAINNRLVFANVPEVPELPEQFREELDAILSVKAPSLYTSTAGTRDSIIAMPLWLMSPFMWNGKSNQGPARQ